jgi:hypothetical protein
MHCPRVAFGVENTFEYVTEPLKQLRPAHLKWALGVYFFCSASGTTNYCSLAGKAELKHALISILSSPPLRALDQGSPSRDIG